ncbi:MAG: hypothetical protein GY749_41910 [Desulfobacteraceae bacterium]|nr:hypothetical protein [Desulfobacteraceae bacterium]
MDKDICVMAWFLPIIVIIVQLVGGFIASIFTVFAPILAILIGIFSIICMIGGIIITGLSILSGEVGHGVAGLIINGMIIIQMSYG